MEIMSDNKEVNLTVDKIDDNKEWSLYFLSYWKETKYTVEKLM